MDNNNNYNAHIWSTCACTKCTSTKLHLLHCSITPLHCSARDLFSTKWHSISGCLLDITILKHLSHHKISLRMLSFVTPSSIFLYLALLLLGGVAIEMICLHVLFSKLFMREGAFSRVKYSYICWFHSSSKFGKCTTLWVLVGMIINTPQGHCEELVEKGRLWSDLGLETRSGTC